MKKTARFGLRISPVEKTWWERTAKERGYSSLAAYITATVNADAQIAPIDKKP